MKPKFLLLCLFLFPVLFSQCDNNDDIENDDIEYVVFDEEEFNTNWEKWKGLDFQNYSFDYYSAGFLYSHLNITIENEDVSSISSLAEEGFQNGDTLTINGLFEDIKTHYPANGIVVEKDAAVYVKEIKVVYDENYFYPKEVHYLLHIDKGVEVDGNFDKYIQNFKILE